MTDFRTSTTAPDVVFTSMHGLGSIEHPIFAATQVMAHPGTNPSVCAPVVEGRLPDVEELWAFLAEPAEFFGFAMPGIDEMRAAIAQFLSALDTHNKQADCMATGATIRSLNVTVVELDYSAQLVVAGTEVQFVRSEPVRIDVCDAACAPVQSVDPLWRRMAARTTSGGEQDQLRRWLNDRGYVDVVSGRATPGAPSLGALVFERDADVCGVANAEPNSILTQLQQCGAIEQMRHVGTRPVDAHRVWWISPGYQVHPVAAIGAIEYAVDEAPPSFTRIR